MAREFIEGFELNNVKNWDYADVSTCSSGATAYDMSGQYYLQLNQNQTIYKNITARDEYYTSCRFRWGNAAISDVGIIKFSNGSTLLFEIRPDVAGLTNHLRAVFGASTFEGSINLTTGVTYRIEARYKPSTSNTGNIQVKINGLLDIDKTSTVTATQTTNISRIGFVGAANLQYIDDIVIETAEWPGNTRIQGKFLTGPGASTQFTPSAGANYDCLEELSSSTAVIVADFVYASSISKKDYYASSTLITGSNPITDIKSMQLTAMAKIDGVCTATKLKLNMLTSAGTTYESSAIALQQDAYTNINYIISDTAAISPAIANGIQLGMTSTS